LNHYCEIDHGNYSCNFPKYDDDKEGKEKEKEKENSTSLNVSHNVYSKTKFKPHPHTGMNLLQNTVLPSKVGPASAVPDFRFVATSTHDKGA
jgi:hypothetical protein